MFPIFDEMINIRQSLMNSDQIKPLNFLCWRISLVEVL